jgi:predicted membrane-bound spermidine synthase
MATITNSDERTAQIAATDAGRANIDPVAARRAARALYLIVLVSGAVLMGVEIAGAKILAPGFGTSTYVWGSIIGLFMGALAAGYYLGGILADKRPSFSVLATIVSLAGVLTVLVPRIGPKVSDYIAIMDLGPVIGPLLAASIIFFVPSFLMGMVSPYAVKLNTRSLAGLGVVAGRLYALSTLGSIIGTLITTFVLIPTMFVSNVLQMLGVLLIAVAALSLWMFRSASGPVSREDRTGLGVMALMALAFAELWAVLPVLPPTTADSRLMYYEDSAYHEILVVEDVVETREKLHDYVLLPVKMWEPARHEKNENLWWFREVRRWLKFNDNTESGIFPYRGVHSNAVGYTDLLHLPVIWQQDPLPQKLMVVGGGGGIVPVQYFQDYGTEVLVAEIDPAVERIARSHFQIPETNKIVFYIGDGRQAVRNAKPGTYDVIVLDAYSSGGQIPFHLLTWEFLAEVKSRLTPRGILISNLISGVKNPKEVEDIPPADLFLSEYKTLRSSRAEAKRIKNATGEDTQPLFKQVYAFPRIRHGAPLAGQSYSDYRNVILLATNEDTPLTRDQIATAARALVDRGVVKVPDYLHHASQLYTPTQAELDAATIMTDDYAPVDRMYRPVRREETMRRVY